jgi:hypothetical protein
VRKGKVRQDEQNLQDFVLTVKGQALHPPVRKGKVRQDEQNLQDFVLTVKGQALHPPVRKGKSDKMGRIYKILF